MKPTDVGRCSRNCFALLFTPDGTLVTASYDGGAVVHDRAYPSLDGMRNDVRSVAVSPDGARVLAGFSNGDAQRWDIRTGARVGSLTGHAIWSWVYVVQFSPDGKYIITCANDNMVRLWGAVDLRQESTLYSHNQWVSCLAWSPDSRHIAWGDLNGTVHVQDVRTNEELCRLHGHADTVSSVTFSPDGQFVLSSSQDETFRLWDVRQGREVRRLSGVRTLKNDGAFSPDGRHYACVAETRSVGVFVTRTGEQVLSLDGCTIDLFGLAFSPDGRRVVTGSSDSTLRYWDLPAHLHPPHDPAAAPLAAAALEGDTVARLALADHLEESGHPLAPTWSCQLRAGNLYPAGYFACANNSWESRAPA